MNLMPDFIRDQLLKNGSAEREADHMPVVKYFDPCGAATWLISEILPTEPDTMFGLCDLGMDCPELGYVNFTELSTVKGKLGLPMERDLHFAPQFPLSVYAHAARAAGRITEDTARLEQSAAALKAEHQDTPIPPAEGG
jgi:hypothetical protein